MCESIGYWPLRGRCPARPSTLITTYSGRARVPLTIWCFCDCFLSSPVCSILVTVTVITSFLVYHPSDLFLTIHFLPCLLSFTFSSCQSSITSIYHIYQIYHFHYCLPSFTSFAFHSPLLFWLLTIFYFLFLLTIYRLKNLAYHPLPFFFLSFSTFFAKASFTFSSCLLSFISFLSLSSFTIFHPPFPI